MPNEEKPHDKGLGEYTRDFVSGLFGRKHDDEEEEKQEAAPAQHVDTSKPLNEVASQVAEQVRQQAAQEAAAKQQEATEKTRHDAAEKAREQLAESIRERAAHTAEQVKPQAQAAAAEAKIEELQRLRDRVKELEADPVVTQQAPKPVRSHTVVSGESLSLIAKHYYGDPMQWKRIFEANRDKISNPDLIHPGQEFVIPE